VQAVRLGWGRALLRTSEMGWMHFGYNSRRPAIGIAGAQANAIARADNSATAFPLAAAGAASPRTGAPAAPLAAAVAASSLAVAAPAPRTCTKGEGAKVDVPRVVNRGAATVSGADGAIGVGVGVGIAVSRARLAGRGGRHLGSGPPRARGDALARVL
jgi:hypothetical protein